MSWFPSVNQSIRNWATRWSGNVRVSYHICDLCGEKVELPCTTISWKKGQEYDICEACEEELYEVLLGMNKKKRDFQ